MIGIPPTRIANRIVQRTGREIHSWIISGIIIAPDSISSFWQLWSFSEAFSPYRLKPINFLPKKGNLSATEHARQAAKLALENTAAAEVPTSSNQWNDSLESAMFLPVWNEDYGNENRRAIAFGA